MLLPRGRGIPYIWKEKLGLQSPDTSSPFLGEPACLQRAQVCSALHPAPAPTVNIPGASMEVCSDTAQPVAGWAALFEAGVSVQKPLVCR